IEQSSLKLKELVSKAQQQVKEINNLALQRKEFSGEHQEFKEKCKTRAPALHQASQYQKTLIKLRQDSKELAAGLDDLNKSSEEAARAADANTEIRNKLDENLKTLKENPLYKDLKESDFENFKREYQHWVGACQELKSLQTVDSHDKRNIELLENEIKNFGEKLEQITDALGVLEQRTTRSNLKTLEQKLYELHELEARLSSFQREAARIKQASQSSAMQLEKCRQAINELEKADIELEKKLELQKDAAKSVRYEGAKLLCLEQSLERQSCVVCDNDDISHLDQNKMEKSFSKLEVYEKDMERSEQEKTSLFQRLEKERTAQKALQASLAQDKERLLTLRGEFISRNHERAGEFQLSEKTLEKQEASRLLETAKDRIKSSIQAGQEDQLEINSLQEKFKAFSSQRDKTRGKLKTLRDEAKERRAKLDEIDKRRKDLEARLQKWAGLERFQETAPNFLQLQEDFFKLVQKQSLAQVEARHLKQRLEDMRRRALQQREQKRKIESESAELVKNIKQASPDMDPQEALEELEKEKDLFEFKNRKFDEDLKELEIEKSAIFSRKQTFSEQLKEQDALLLIHWRQLCELLRKRLGPQKELKTSCLELSKLLEQIANLETPCDKETLLLCQELALKEASLSKAAMEERKDNLTEYKTLLARQNSAQEKIRELQKELERAKALKSEWEELYQLIGKDEFRNYILAMVEKLLIQQTNLELAKLCDGRYLIQHKKTSSKLAPDFYIIDKFRGEEVRKVSTLSGGETFMVSLAMALALAELTRGNADLDSFFIDEGFGSLDQDSLEEALEMLQDIETRGKQIGLISHVKELTQRIPVNIHLQKNRLGNSSIEILYN
ncbi:MAG: SMC family ATPase, partial [Bacteriovoracaceae bacterium]